MSASVSIESSADEAVVLFEWPAGLGAAKVAIGDAGQRVRWRIERVLEKLFVEPFANDYAEPVEQARRRILAG